MFFFKGVPLEFVAVDLIGHILLALYRVQSEDHRQVVVVPKLVLFKRLRRVVELPDLLE